MQARPLCPYAVCVPALPSPPPPTPPGAHASLPPYLDLPCFTAYRILYPHTAYNRLRARHATHARIPAFTDVRMHSTNEHVSPEHVIRSPLLPPPSAFAFCYSVCQSDFLVYCAKYIYPPNVGHTGFTFGIVIICQKYSNVCTRIKQDAASSDIRHIISNMGYRHIAACTCNMTISASTHQRKGNTADNTYVTSRGRRGS
jgi:hypothetical protein